MSDYRVEKLRHPISVILRDGSQLEGDVFLRPVSRHRARPEEPVDLLNEAEAYFALVQNDDATIVAKANVLRVETSYDVEDDLHVAIPGVPVAVTLCDGSVVRGNVFIESRADRPRLLDLINGYHGRFLPVVDATQVVLVNTQTIAHVREDA